MGESDLKRDFTDEAKEELKEIIQRNNEKDEGYFLGKVIDVAADIINYDDLDIENYYDNIQAYHEKVVDKEDMTISQLDSIFQKVNVVDGAYQWNFDIILSQLEYYNRTVQALGEIMVSSSGDGYSFPMSLSSEAFREKYGDINSDTDKVKSSLNINIETSEENKATDEESDMFTTINTNGAAITLDGVELISEESNEENNHGEILEVVGDTTIDVASEVSDGVAIIDAIVSRTEWGYSYVEQTKKLKNQDYHHIDNLQFVGLLYYSELYAGKSIEKLIKLVLQNFPLYPIKGVTKENIGRYIMGCLFEYQLLREVDGIGENFGYEDKIYTFSQEEKKNLIRNCTIWNIYTKTIINGHLDAAMEETKDAIDLLY